MISFTMDGIEYRAYNHLYAVSRCGKVLRKYRPYAPKTHPLGYLVVGHKLVHRIVAQCWMETFDPRKQIHHVNEVKTDNRLENLECLTAREHLLERHVEAMYRLGRYARSEETRSKIRKYRLGRITSEETKEKQRAALLGRKRPYFARAAHSEESRKQRSETHTRNTRCRVLGVEYRSFAEASEGTGVHRFTVRKRCLSKNFPDYEVIS